MAKPIQTQRRLDGMIASIARVNGGRLATRNVTVFRTVGLELINPWDSGTKLSPAAWREA